MYETEVNRKEDRSSGEGERMKDKVNTEVNISVEVNEGLNLIKDVRGIGCREFYYTNGILNIFMDIYIYP